VLVLQANGRVEKTRRVDGSVDDLLSSRLQPGRGLPQLH
jgi:hypothetical protein